MTIHTLIAALTAVLAPTSQTASVAGIPVELDGNGRACFGTFKHTATSLNWKSTFAHCNSTFQVVKHDDKHWVLKVNKGKSCSYEIIDVDGKPQTDAPGPYWNITGYVKASEYGRLDSDSTGCGMIPANWKPE